ncbi:MAG: Na(+)-translocating NADH-quinone reductase subunit F [Turneriella sp.]|nr:Na(+)-translocating NADH-quinone reductase subunit F [Turneriella sp.]
MATRYTSPWKGATNKRKKQQSTQRYFGHVNRNFMLPHGLYYVPCIMFQWTQSSVIIQIRLTAALILVFYTATHFLNHALGLFSIDAMEVGRHYFLLFWRNTVLQFLFPLALFLHVSSVLLRLMFHRNWNFSTREKVKIFTGLSIPFFLLLHIASTRLEWWMHGFNDTYSYYLYFNFKGVGIFLLLAMTILIWTHAYLGLTDILRLKTWYERYRTTFAVVFTAIPVLGLSGVISAAMQVHRLAKDSQWLARVAEIHGNPQIAQSTQYFYYSVLIASLVGLLVLLYFTRTMVLRQVAKKLSITVTYTDGRQIRIAPDTTLLDASLMNHIEHAHVCGGNGRCSTCRVRVLSGAENLSLPEARETALLTKVQAEKDVRLACQTKVKGDVKIALLIPPHKATPAGAAQLLKPHTRSDGAEKQVVVFFSDLKGFTSFSEHKLPYDIVFVLNQYFRSMGKIIEEHGGFIDKFIGDGIMAVFGLTSDIHSAAQNALKASFKMQAKLQEINNFLIEEVTNPLQVRIGLHAGTAIVGEMGYGTAMQITAIGDVVNTASRMEHANKKTGTWLLFSENVATLAGASTDAIKFRARVQLRGKSDTLQVFGIPRDVNFTEPNLWP